ncbi:MAG: CPBP family intramembrane metalloprotease [Micropruina sp.]|nr:CPBP family intramembrane metalloprotease [Micropruina sp.]
MVPLALPARQHADRHLGPESPAGRQGVGAVRRGPAAGPVLDLPAGDSVDLTPAGRRRRVLLSWLPAAGLEQPGAEPWFGVVTSAAIFALFHVSQQNLPLFLDRFAFGVLAGVLVVRTGGLEAAIGAHVVNNVLAFVSAGLVTSIAEVKAIQQVGWSEAAWDLAGFTFFTLAALWLGRRMNVATHTPGQRRAEDLDPWAAS